ncbi:MAG: TetR/AcrR family transcriptional regulator [Sneathiella sp.]|nr:TetR/AcrR family transcriptional regulator [Sneathiella sp.]
MSISKIRKTEKDRRRNILASAIRVFERDGLAKASMRIIAKEAGCTTGAIYPLFSGKEDIYATLLEVSLDELQNKVAKAAAGESDAKVALLFAATSFFEYYANKRFELDLGLYLFGFESARSLGREKDTILNVSLLRTLDIFGACFKRLAPIELKAEEAAVWAQNERDALFASLIGILMLAHTGRASSIGTDPRTILQTTVQGIINKLKNNTVIGEYHVR